MSTLIIEYSDGSIKRLLQWEKRVLSILIKDIIGKGKIKVWTEE